LTEGLLNSQETCGRILCGVGRPAHSAARVADSERPHPLPLSR